MSMRLQCRSAWVTLAARNFELLTQFYASLLEQPSPNPAGAYVEFQLPGLRLGIYHPRQSELATLASRPSSLSLCLEVEDLEAAIAHITSLGYPPSEETIVAAHGREIDVYDPEGNRLILYQPAAGRGGVDEWMSEGVDE